MINITIVITCEICIEGKFKQSLLLENPQVNVHIM